MANLPVVIFQFAMSPYDNWQQLAWEGALIITFAILILSIVARIIVSALNPGRSTMSDSASADASSDAAAPRQQRRPRPSRSRCGTSISTTARPTR